MGTDMQSDRASAPDRSSWGDFAEVGYERLAGVLQQAHDQAAMGKGNARHANGKPFLKQPIMEIGRMVGTGYLTGQIMKKAQEANSMAGRGDHSAAKAEILGIINYAAAAFLLIEERGPDAMQRMASSAYPSTTHLPPSKG